MLEKSHPLASPPHIPPFLPAPLASLDNNISAFLLRSNSSALLAFFLYCQARGKQAKTKETELTEEKERGRVAKSER